MTARDQRVQELPPKLGDRVVFLADGLLDRHGGPPRDRDTASGADR
jgi:hypothetical protein